MAASRTLYSNVAAQRFRDIIRPSLVGNLGKIERNISLEAANELGQWMTELVIDAIRSTRLKDQKGEAAKQLNAGIRIYGRSSLTSLRSVINVQPWLIAQEFGAHILPTGDRKFLAIPIFYGLRADGSPKFRNPSSWKRFGSFVYKAKSGKFFLAYKSAGGELRILYVLVDDVTIKPVLGLIRTAGQNLPKLMSVWGQIYLREATKPQYKVFDLWDRAYL